MALELDCPVHIHAPPIIRINAAEHAFRDFELEVCTQILIASRSLSDLTLSLRCSLYSLVGKLYDLLGARRKIAADKANIQE